MINEDAFKYNDWRCLPDATTIIKQCNKKDTYAVKIDTAKNIPLSLFDFSKSYFESAHLIATRMIDKMRIDELDLYVFPLFFLYRHSLELLLKSIGLTFIVDEAQRQLFLKDTFHNLKSIYEYILQRTTFPRNTAEHQWLLAYFDNISQADNGFPVKAIKDYAFRNCNSITSITMFSNITSIGDQAFKGCENLINVSIPSNITDISSDAFYGCANLHYSIFDNAYYLGNESNPYVALIKVQDESIISCVIKDGTKIVCESAFAYCDGLKSVTIPDSLSVIGYNAFDDCKSLDGIYISDLSAWCNILFNTYESHPLYYAEKLYLDNEPITDLEIPNTITNIGDYAFYYYESLKSVIIPNGVTSIGCGAFSHCTNLESVIMGNDVDIIGSQAFYGCTSLTSILMSKTLTTIESYAFDNCTSLVNVNIPDSVTSIASLAFCGCSNLKEIKIPYGVSTINSSTFYNCTSLTAIDIPDSVTSIGSTAFKGCTSLANITIPKNISSIGASAFSDCTNLIGVYITDMSAWCAISFESEDTLYMTCQSNPLYYAKNLYLNNNLVIDLLIPPEVSQIGNYAFLGCTSIISVTISDSVTTIGASAFSNCKNLEKVTIGSGVSRINEYAFSSCDNLMGVYLNDVASWCKVAFSNSVSNPLNYANKLYLNNELVTNLIIPEGVTGIQNYAFAHCSSITMITIPDSVIGIGDFAFYDCSNLTSVTMGNGVSKIGYRAFYNFPTLKTVYYKGTESKWSKISMDSNNSALTNAPIYYYSSTQPEISNSYWHYVDGIPTIWN